MLRSRPAHPRLGPGVVEHPGRVVEGLADVDPAGDQVGSGVVDVVDAELEAFERAGPRPP